jgi:hypothetical protein
MIDDTEARIVAAKAALEEAAARRAANAAKRETPESRAKRAELEAENEIALANAEEAHGEIGVVLATVTTADGHLVVVKRPHPLVWRTARQEIQTKNDQKLDAAAAKLVRQCLVHPTQAAYEALVEQQGALPDTLIKLIAKLAGAELSGE